MTRLQEIERALNVVAMVVATYPDGDAAVPLLDRLEREMETARHALGHKDRARQILAGSIRGVSSVGVA